MKAHLFPRIHALTNHLTLLLIFIITTLTIGNAWGAGSETFENASNSNSYGSVTWKGDNGLNWSASSFRTDQKITGNRGLTSKASTACTITMPLTTAQRSEGMGVFTFKYKYPYSDSGKTNNLSFTINGTTYTGTVSYNSNAQTVNITVNQGNLPESITINIASGGRACFDDFSWTSYVSANPYTVTLKDDNSTLPQSTAGAAITLPSRDGCDGYTFAGWTKSWYAYQTSWTPTAPTIIPAGSYTPTADENLYPVYTKTEGGTLVPATLTASYSSHSGWTATGCGGSSYWVLKSGASITSPVIPDLSTVTSITFSVRTYGGSSYNTVNVSTSGGTSIGSASASNTNLTSKTINVSNLSGSGSIVFSSSTTSNANGPGINNITINYSTGGSTTYYISVPDCATQTTITLSPPPGGTGGTSSVTATYGQPMPEITPPTLTGYDFQGYFTANGGTGTKYYNADGTSARDWDKEDATFTLIAYWKAKTYTVTLDNQEATTAGATSVTATYNAAMPSIASNLPKKTGYAFQGYFDAISGGTKYYNADGTSAMNWDKTSATTLYAQWTCVDPTNINISGEYIRFPGETIELTVSGDNIAADATYVWKKGDQVITDQTTETLTIANATIANAGNYLCEVTNGTCSESGDFTIKMYSLRGLIDWHTDLVFVKESANIASCSIELNGNSSYEFKVFDGGAYYGNTGAEPTMTSTNCTNWPMQQNSGNNVTLKTVVSGIYTFKLDYSDSSNPTISVIYPQKKMVYLNPGVWDVDNAKFALHAWGSIEQDVLMTKIDDCNGRNIYVAEIDANNSNIIFIRGNTNYDISNPWHNVWNQTGDLVVENEQYSVGKEWDFSQSAWTSFTPNYSVTFNANGHGTAPANQCVAEGGQVKTPTAPTATGYTFGGWYKEAGCTNAWDFAVDVVTSDIILYAKWTINTHTLTWNVNGGNALTGTYTSGTLAYGTTITKPADPTRTGYTFLGWHDGTNIVTPATTMPDDNLTYTAQWAPISITITWDANGGSVTPTSSSYTYDGAEVDMPKPIRNQDQFDGWFTSIEGGEKIEEIGKKNKPITSVTYYARWKKRFSITWIVNGDELELDARYTTSLENDIINKPESAFTICDGKEFVGWSEQIIAEETDTPPASFYAKDADIVASKDVTYHAVWADETPGDLEEIEDRLNRAMTGITKNSSSYFDWTGKTVTSSAVYAGNSAGGNDAIQLRSNNSNSGIITTTSGGKIKKVVVSWNSNTSGNRTLNIYGKNTSYTSPSELYDTEKQGELLGEIHYEVNNSTTTTIDVTGDYSYIGLRSNYGAMYLSAIDITWTTGTPPTYSAYTTSCVEAVWNGAEIDNATIAVNCGETSPMNSAATISFPAELNHSLKKEITLTASNGFLVSTNKTDDTKYGKSVTVSPVKTGTNAGTITQNVYVRAVASAANADDFTGTITISGDQIETQTINVTADVTCTSYTLTLVDRGIPTEQPEKYFAGQMINEPPVAPEGVCTDPIHYFFDGWAEEEISSDAISYSKVSFPYTVVGNTKFYAVYRYVEEGSGDSGDYVKLTEELDDYSGDYLIVYEDGSLALNGALEGDNLDASGNSISVSINDNTILATDEINEANFTIAKEDDHEYSIRSASGYYIGQSTNANDLKANSTKYYANTITLANDDNVDIVSSGAYLRYNANSGNTNLRFRYYKSDSYTAQKAIVLYKKEASYLYTSSPNCGPTMVAKEGMWVTSAADQSVMVRVPISLSSFESNVTITGTCANTHFSVATLENVGNGVESLLVTYTPTEHNQTEDASITLTAHEGESVLSTTTFTLKGRSLPETFAVVAMKNAAYYALPANMPEAATYKGLHVNVEDDAVIAAPTTHLYSLKSVHNTRFEEHDTQVRLVGNNEACLWASNAKDGTNIRNWAQLNNADGAQYEWSLYTEDGDTYSISCAAVTEEGRILRMYGDNFGMYKSGANVFRLMPVNCTEQPMNVQVSSTRVTATIAWTNAAACKVDVYLKSNSSLVNSIASKASPVTITGLTETTEYTFTLTPVGATDCAMNGAFKTSGPDIDIVEWMTDGIIIQVDKDESVNPKVVIKGEVEHNTGSGVMATELFYREFETLDDSKTLEDFKYKPEENLYKLTIDNVAQYSCLNIQVQINDPVNGTVLTEQTAQVPILVTAANTTTDGLFSNIIDGDLDASKTRCSTCDVVVLNGATLTKAAAETANDVNQVRNLYIYPGAKLIVPENADDYSVNSISFRRVEEEVGSASVETTMNITSSSAAPIYVDVRVNAENWHWFTLPYDCNIADVTWVDGSKPMYGVDWFLSTYDGEKRAATQSGGCWAEFHGDVIKAGVGYIVGIAGYPNKPKVKYELRFPMSKDVLAKEKEDKTVPVYAWGVENDMKPIHKGWNLVGNPYLDFYKKNTLNSFNQGLRLGGEYVLNPSTGYWEDSGKWNGETSNLPYVVVPIDGGWSAYEQVLVSEIDLLPFTAYFVQVAETGHTNGQLCDVRFEATNRGKASIARRAPSEISEDEEPVIVGVKMTNAQGESDKTSLVIDDRYTEDYEMNADFFKWFGDYYRYYTKPVIYTIGTDNEQRAFNALPEVLAAQPVSVGTYTAQNGEYTFSLDRRSDLTRVKEVWLHDATENIHTNLMQGDYTFTAGRTDGSGRFSIAVSLLPKMPTDCVNGSANGVYVSAQQRTLYLHRLPEKARVWVYDAVGKLLVQETTQAYQRAYKLNQAGVYFVRVESQEGTVTLQAIVE